MAILGICIKIETSRTGNRSMCMDISRWQIVDLGTLSSLIVTRGGRWLSGQRGCRFTCKMSVLVGWRCTLSFAPPACRRILCGAVWHGRQLSVRFWPSIAGCLAISAFTVLCPGNAITRFFSSRTSVQGFLITYCISSVAVCENPPLAVLATFKDRSMSDYSSCTRPPCLAMVADMMGTYKKLVVVTNNKIWQLPEPYKLP